MSHLCDKLKSNWGYISRRLNFFKVFILQSGLSESKMQRQHFEDRWICQLQMLQPTGINTEIHQYAKDMYERFGKIRGTDKNFTP